MRATSIAAAAEKRRIGMIRVSLITPTRNRPEDLRRLMESLLETTKNPETVEVLFYVDDDDKTTLDLIGEFNELYKCLNIKFFVGPRSDHFSKDYFNFLSLRASGRWVMAINDDSIFRTPGWEGIIDQRMSAAAEQFGDDILLGVVKDPMVRRGREAERPTMSCWLLSSKEYVNLMNGILIETIYTWGGDYWLGHMFDYVRGGQRKVFILEVFIDHNSHHSNPQRPPDQQLPQPESFANFQRIESEHPVNSSQLEQVVQRMANVVESYLKMRGVQNETSNTTL